MPHILVIDDDPSVRNILEEFLKMKRFEVSVVGDGEMGVEVIQEKKIDLYLVDLVLPGMGGMEVLKKISSLLPVFRPARSLSAGCGPC